MTACLLSGPVLRLLPSLTTVATSHSSCCCCHACFDSFAWNAPEQSLRVGPQLGQSPGNQARQCNCLGWSSLFDTAGMLSWLLSLLDESVRAVTCIGNPMKTKAFVVCIG